MASLVVANLSWTTLCLGGYRPETMWVTLLLTGATLVIFCVERATRPTPAPRFAAADWLLLLFLVYAALNALLISPVPWLGWIDWLAWANAAAIYWISRHGVRSLSTRRVMFIALVLLGIFAVGLGCYQRFVQPDWLMLGRTQVDQFLARSSGPFGIPNTLAGLLILLLPAAVALAFRSHATATQRVWWIWVVAVLAFGLWLTVSRGGWIALALALVVWPLTLSEQRWQKRAFAAVLVLALLVVMGAVLYRTAPIVRDRFDRLVLDSGELSRPILWRAAVKIFAEHPVVGGGAGSYNVRFERHRPKGFVDEPQWAHNEYLNTLADYGAIGLGLLLGAVIFMIAARRTTNNSSGGDAHGMESRNVRHGFAIGALAFALQMLVDFHLKIPALAMSLAVVGALALGPSGESAPRPAARRLRWWVAAILVLVALIPVGRFYRGEALRYGARQAIDSVAGGPIARLEEMLPRAEADLRRAVALAPNHAASWADLAFALELRAFANPAETANVADFARVAADRAVALSEVVPEFWIRLGVALDLLSRRSDAAQAFEKAVKLAPRSAYAWYYYAHHLSFATDTRDAALRAIATSLSLDPANRAAEALQLKLNERSPGVPFNP
jgi:O-antigen ligase